MAGPAAPLDAARLGPGDWVELRCRQVIPFKVFVRVRVDAVEGVVADGLTVLGDKGHAVTASALRQHRFGEALAEAAIGYARHLGTTGLFAALEVEAVTSPPPPGRVVVDDKFLAKVSAAYAVGRKLAPDRPIVWVAEWAGRPVSTVSRWLSRARSAGYLAQDEGGQ